MAASAPDSAWINGYTYNEHWIVDGWVEAHWADAGSGQLTFAPGETTKTITVRIVNDELFEEDETFSLLLTSASGAFIVDAVGEGTILDDEFNRAPSFTVGANLVVSDDAGPQSVSAWATDITPGPAGEAGQALTFLVEVDDASLFSSAPQISTNGTLSFTPNAGAFGVATVTVRLQDDGGTATNSLGSTGDDTSAPQTFTIAIGPTLAINDVSVSEADGTATFTVTLSRAASETVTVDWQAVDHSAARPADYSPQIWIDGYQAGHAEPGYDVNSYWVEEGYWQNGYDVSSYWIWDGYDLPGYDVNGYDVVLGHWQNGYDVNSYWAEDGYWLPGFDVAGYYDENNMWVEPFWAAGETPDAAWTGGYTANPHWIVTGGHWAGGTWIAADEPDAAWVNGYTANPHWIDDGSYTVQSFWSDATEPNPAWVNGYTYNPHWIDTSHGGGGTWIAADVPNPEWNSGYNQNPHWIVTGGHWTGDFWSAGTTTDPAWTSGYTYHEQWIDDGWVDGYWQNAASGQLTFAPGETEKTIRVRIVNDPLVEASETYSLVLANATGAYIADAQGTGTIVDNDAVANQPPTITVPGPQSMVEDGYVLFSTADATAIVVADPDANQSLVQVSLTVDEGALWLSDDFGLTFSTGSAYGSAAMTFQGTLSDVNAALDGLGFALLEGYSGTATLSISVNDLGNSGAGGPLTASATVAINISALPPPPPNEAPEPTDDSFQMREGRTLSGNVLTNDSDADDDWLSVVAFDGSTPHGSVSLYANGSFDYRPDAGFIGQDTFNYTTLDGRGGESTATVTIDVLPLPTLSINDIEVREDEGSATFNVELSQAFDEEVTFNWATYGQSALPGEDYTADSGELTFAPGETQKTISVDVIDNIFANFGADKKFHVGISTPSNAKVNSAAAQATIIDDDVAVAVGYTFPGGASGVAGPFEVRLSQASDQVIEVAYSTSGTSFIPATSGTLTFAPGVTSQSIAIELPDDEPGVDRAPEVMTISLSSAQNASVYVSESKAIIDGVKWHTEQQEVWHWNPEHELVPESSYDEYDEFGNVTTITIPEHWIGGYVYGMESVWVSEADSFNGPWVEIESAEASETDGYVRFTVHVYGNAEEPVTVNWATLYGTATPDDFTPATGSVTIEGGDTSATFDVAITRDDLRESPESFYVYVTSIAAAGHTYGSNYFLAATGTIYDVWADAAVDSDNDGLLASDIDEEAEEAPLGRILLVNYDDDNGDDIRDADQPGYIQNENDLVAVRLSAAFGRAGTTNLGDDAQLRAMLRMDEASRNIVQLWRDANKAAPINLSDEYAWDELPDVIYAEGLQVGDATIELVMLRGAAPPIVVDTMKFTAIRLDLDVNNNGNLDDDVDGTHRFLPGQVGDEFVIATGDSFNTVQYVGQKVRLILDGISAAMGIDEALFEIVKTTNYAGWTGNASGAAVEGEENDDDYSFAEFGNQRSQLVTLTGENALGVNLWVKDTGAMGRIMVRLFRAGAVAYTMYLQPSLDSDEDGLADAWERSQVEDWNAQYGTNETDFLKFFSANDDKEMRDPDGAGALVAQKSAGDGLTAATEFRGFILDGGGANAGLELFGEKLKRLSPAQKEALLEVDRRSDANLAQLPPGGVRGYLNTAARIIYREAGIALYFVLDDENLPPPPFSNNDAQFDAHVKQYLAASRGKPGGNAIVDADLNAYFTHLVIISDGLGQRTGYTFDNREVVWKQRGMVVDTHAFASVQTVMDINEGGEAVPMIEIGGTTIAHEFIHVVIAPPNGPKWLDEHRVGFGPGEGPSLMIAGRDSKKAHRRELTVRIEPTTQAAVDLKLASAK